MKLVQFIDTIGYEVKVIMNTLATWSDQSCRDSHRQGDSSSDSGWWATSTGRDLTTLNRDGARHGMKDEKSRRQMHERLLVDQPVPEADQWIQESSRWRSSAKDSRPGADSSRCPELCFGLVLEPPELSSSFSHDPTFWALIPMRLVPMLIVNDCTAIIISSFQLWIDWKAHAIDTQSKVKVNSKLRKR